MTVNIEMDPDVPDGEGWCDLPDGRTIKIRISDQAPPKGTAKVRLSMKDWTWFLSETKDAP